MISLLKKRKNVPERERMFQQGVKGRMIDRHLGGNLTSLSAFCSVWNDIGWGRVVEALVLDAGSFMGSQRMTK